MLCPLCCYLIKAGEDLAYSKILYAACGHPLAGWAWDYPVVELLSWCLLGFNWHQALLIKKSPQKTLDGLPQGSAKTSTSGLPVVKLSLLRGQARKCLTRLKGKMLMKTESVCRSGIWVGITDLWYYWVEGVKITLREWRGELVMM